MILPYYLSELKLSIETYMVYLKSFKTYSVCEGVCNTPLFNSGSLWVMGLWRVVVLFFITFLYYPDV